MVSSSAAALSSASSARKKTVFMPLSRGSTQRLPPLRCRGRHSQDPQKPLAALPSTGSLPATFGNSRGRTRFER